MLLGRRYQGLHDVDVALPAVRQELRLQAVVAEALDLAGARSTDSSAQMWAASSRWALPEKMTMSRMGLLRGGVALSLAD